MKAMQPEDVDRLFGERVSAGDIEGVVALYEPEATLLAAPGQPVTGHDAIREVLAGFAGAKAQIACSVIATVPGGGDLAVCYNDWSGSVEGPGGERVPIAGKAIEVVRRQADGSWLFVVDDANART